MNNNNLNNVVNEVKKSFDNYFELVGGKNFKQFYYDWHVDNMLAPFAGMVEYFAHNHGDKAKNMLHNFTKETALWLEEYDVDNPKRSLINTKKFSATKDGKLSNLVAGVRTFGFECRQFVYSFATREDHHAEFGYWPVKANMPYSSKHGLMLAKDILLYLDEHFEEIANSDNVYRSAQKAADTFFRQDVAKTYAYNDKYNFESRKEAIKELHNLRNRLSLAYKQTDEFSSELANMFQVEEKEAAPLPNKYWPCGFELEFYVPEEYADYHVLAEYLKQKNDWKKLYFSNKDASVYSDRGSAGVIMRDESLAPYDGLFPVEFASRVMYSKDDEKYCLKLLDAFEEGHVNKHCSLHQHLSADSLDLDAYKRLVKRMMQHEDEIVGAFAAPERRDNNLLYATYVSRNLSSQGKRDYPFLAIMVDLCDSRDELKEMVSFGNKYKTLNVMPEHTIEMRAMNANFNKKFFQAYLQFNREFVAAAAENNPHHMNYFLLNKYTWYNNQSTDTKTVMHKLNYGYDFVPHDSYRPMKRQVSTELVQQEQDYARVVAHALECTKKLRYYNSSFNKRARGMVANGR